MNASDKIVRIVEDLLACSSIQHCPIHVILALFAAMGMQAVQTRSTEVVFQQPASVKLRLCMIALSELQNSWPVSGWILQLFTKIVRRLRGVSQDDGLKDRSSGTLSSSNVPHHGNGKLGDRAENSLGVSTLTLTWTSGTSPNHT